MKSDIRTAVEELLLREMYEDDSNDILTANLQDDDVIPEELESKSLFYDDEVLGDDYDDDLDI